MYKHSLWTLLLVLPLFFACKGERSPDSAAEEVDCTYSYNASSTTLEWKAFKFTERAEVPGTFDQLQIEGINEAASAEELLRSLSFRIETNSVNTDKPDRDAKIHEHFFQTMNTAFLEGKVVSLDLAKGKAQISLTMNGVEKTVSGEAKLNADLFSFTALIDVNDWNGQKAITTLNTVCDSLHTGPDGISKLWSEVEVSFTTQLKVVCK